MRKKHDTTRTVAFAQVQTAAADACLVLIYGAHDLGKRFELKSEITIGRDRGNDIVVEVADVSRQHARLSRLENGEWRLTDLASRNGTRRNGEVVKGTVTLANGDLIALGGVIFKYIAGGNIEALFHEEIYRMTIFDGLTKVANKRFLCDFLDREISRASRYGSPLSVAMLDIDLFKEINDTHGHPFADGILQTIAERLRSRLRATDVLARVGGDEFAMLLPGMTGELATSVVHRTRSEVGTVAGGVDLSWCAGIASYPIDAQDAETLLECADAALYCAKSSSDASVCVYDPDDADASRSAEERSVIETLLEYDDAVVPVFQPLISLTTGRIAGYEALARFPHPPARRPDEWFALARAYGLGPALEAYAARAALSAPDRPAGTFLSFNLSASALSSDAVLEALPHDLSDIVIEITDNTLDSDQELLAAQLGPLRARGARIAVDDAGAGYAALQHVMRVRPDIIKLDRALVANVDSDPARAALVDAYVRFARRTGAAICAEGIETPEELRVLADLEVAYGQGFGVARPAPPWSSVSAWVPGAISTRPHTNGDRPRRELALPPIRLALADGLKAGDLATVTELIATELDVDEAAVMRRAGSDAAFEAVSDHPWLAAGQKLALSRHPTIRRLIARGDAVELGAGDSGAEPDELALLAAAGARSILFAPVVSDGDVIGVLACVSRSERSWSHADTGCAVILAQELAAAVEVAPDLDPV